MPGPVKTVDEVPLSDVLPRDHAAAAGRLLRLAHDLEVHPMAAEHVQWHWYPEHNTKPVAPKGPGYELLVFDTTITLFSQSFDWLELTLNVAWSPELTVNAAVEVACWCASDHNMHPVREGHWPVEGPEGLVEAFAAGVAMVAGVLNSGPFNPRPWRLEAGLPDAPPETR